MTVSVLEMETQRRLTVAYIDTAPIVVALVPQSRVKTATGGHEVAELPPRLPQTMRLIELGLTPTDPVVTADGTQSTVSFELLATHDATVERFDMFVHGGYRYEVVERFHHIGWETRGKLVRTPVAGGA